jgi:hypothetical protein
MHAWTLLRKQTANHPQQTKHHSCTSPVDIPESHPTSSDPPNQKAKQATKSQNSPQNAPNDAKVTKK